MKDFKEYIQQGIVRKQDPNMPRAQSLIEESKNKKQYLETTLKLIPKDNLNANVIIDQCYDIIIELIRAKLQLDGYNTGQSHEAEVSYLTILGFSLHDAKSMDELRYYRNGTKYYGVILEMKYATQIILFMRQMHAKLIKILEKQSHINNS
jgi:hypothetical protein